MGSKHKAGDCRICNCEQVITSLLHNMLYGPPAIIGDNNQPNAFYTSKKRGKERRTSRPDYLSTDARFSKKKEAGPRSASCHNIFHDPPTSSSARRLEENMQGSFMRWKLVKKKKKKRKDLSDLSFNHQSERRRRRKKSSSNGPGTFSINNECGLRHKDQYV